MLTRIDLDLFKCFKSLRLPVGALTLLSGTNAAGKSTVLQALVLLHQTMLDNEWSDRLLLNGSEIQLGKANDIVDKENGRNEFKIGVVDDEDGSIDWTFNFADQKDALSVPLTKIQINEDPISIPELVCHLLPAGESPKGIHLTQRLKELTYLMAERLGPRDLYQLQDPTVTQVVGPTGHNAVGMLYQKRDSLILPGMILEGCPPTLLRQVEARMRQFFPGTAIEVNPVPRTNLVTLGLKTSDATDFHRPVNVGFGLSQVLPIITAALASRERSILLIENPEVHLHPSGQAMMGQFLATVASAGVQVIVESHSDHILNGIRRTVKRGQIKAEKVVLHFFRSRDGENNQVVSPTLDAKGNIDHWPKGFFDQIDEDLNYFAGWGE